MNLIRIGKLIVNFDHVTDVMPGDLSGLDPESLLVHLVSGKVITFTGDDAHGLRAFLDRTVKTAVKPLEDFVVQ